MKRWDWDREKLWEELEYNQAEIGELLAVFKASSQQLLADIKRALEAGALTEAREKAHALKGACGTIYFREGARLALGLEQAPDLDTAKKIFSSLYKLVGEFNKELDRFI